MNSSTIAPSRQTQEVLNQAPPLTGYDLFLSDKILAKAVAREGAEWATQQLSDLGRLLGTEEVQRWGFDANENEPVLYTHDRYGHRRDEVVFHPSWHNLMRISVEHQLHSLPWVEVKKPEVKKLETEKPEAKKPETKTAEKKKGAQVARAALMMMTAQNEAGHTCPISMTFSGMAALRAEPELAREWEPRLLSSVYDPQFRPAQEKKGALMGMGMTEKQGGSDVRANTTQAEQIGRSREYLVTGHKWFCSAPMCDAFLVLAQAPKGLSCFFLPRWTPTGERNHFHLQRLKRKMGNRSNASSEVEFAGAWAQLVGDEGRGINTIIEMVHHTRLDCAIAGAALMRQALVQAVHHARHRKAFGKLLIDQPLMRNVLADLTIESEAATLFMARLASSFDARESDQQERAFSRIATAIGKYWLCKRACVQVGEALECLGGNGFVEESMMPRLYREAPLNSIWEGSGNVICLDILRALAKEPASLDALLAEIRLPAGADPRFHAFIADVESSLVKGRNGSDSEGQARRLAEKLALALQASLLMRHGSPAVAEAFCITRLAGDHGYTFGTLPTGVDINSILASQLDR